MPGASDPIELRVGGLFVPRDPTRSEGWDFTSSTRSEITLFGGTCERVTRTGAEVIAEIACPDADEE